MKALEFQVISWYAEDIDVADLDDGSGGGSDDSAPKKKRSNHDDLYYVTKAFGRTASGESASLTITDIKPFFYIKVNDNWTDSCTETLCDALVKEMGQKCFLNLSSTKTVKRKDIWGFTNFKEFKFVQLSFKSCRYMRYAAKFFSTREVECRRLHAKPHKYEIYESNMEPYLRFFHMNEISPCGWLSVDGRDLEATTMMMSTSKIDRQASASKVHKGTGHVLDAPFVILSFDIECMSITGDFPVPKRDFGRLAQLLYDNVKRWSVDNSPYTVHIRATRMIARALGVDRVEYLGSAVHDMADTGETTTELDRIGIPTFHFEATQNPKALVAIFIGQMDDILNIIKASNVPPAPVAAPKESKEKSEKDKEKERVQEVRDRTVGVLTRKLNSQLPKLMGDPIIQIGTTVHKYGDRKVSYRHVVTLGTCSDIPTMADGVPTIVQACETEFEVLVKWAELVRTIDPDVVTGYNIFGFDMQYIEQRAHELRCKFQVMNALNRILHRECEFKTQLLSSSALGDNWLNYIDMPGRVLLDLMKVVQRDHKLDSYKLDDVAEHFTGLRKHDVSPQDIFRLHKGSADDRRRVAEYCVQDCELVNGIVIKLEVLANNMGMANVCYVPLSYIFMRGQGIKIFSLVLNQCHKDGFVVPVKKVIESKPGEVKETYEGAIVLDPMCDIYLDQPVSVLDYASLYPSSMISENLSHDCIVLPEQMEKYGNLPDVHYEDIQYGNTTCRFAHNRQGLLPRTLIQLLGARKNTRAKMLHKRVAFKDGRVLVGSINGNVLQPDDGSVAIGLTGSEVIEDAYSEFQKAVLDGLQNAYKVTANSLYGQMGANTSQLFLKPIAACTTATGRSMILKAKAFLEDKFSAKIVYGDTDSIFCIFPSKTSGQPAIKGSIAQAHAASKAFKTQIKEPHDLEYDKTFWPFILLSKKRYVGNMYEDSDTKFKQKSMGIVLKRRDNAPIVKSIYGGVIDIILNKNDVNGSVKFLKAEMDKLVAGDCPLEKLIVSKSLKEKYSDPAHIAHKVLADRMADRDPGTRPQIGDRVPYVYFAQSRNATLANKKKPLLQGERIEHPDFIRKHDLQPDYHFYITNQIMKPILQIYGIVVERLEGYGRPLDHFKSMAEKLALKEKDPAKVSDKIVTLRETCAMEILFSPTLGRLECKNNGNRDIADFFRKIAWV